LDEPATASNQRFQRSKNEGPGRFVMNFGGRLYMVGFW